MTEPVLHPVQKPRNHQQSLINSEVTLAAYEVYSHVFQPQPAMVEGNCRGGFGCGELICFLYAKTFPKDQWKSKFEEAMKGTVNL